MFSPLLAAIALLQFVAMAFLIIACVTAPVFRQIGLGRNSGTTYGVFGYCETIVGCTTAKGQYSVPAGGSQGDTWLFSKNSREKLGHLLIATPIAAGLNFFAFLSLMITLISILVSRKNSSRSAIAFFINLFLIIWAFLGATFVCLVCFFTFWPHVTWVTWILIPAAALPLIEIPTVFFAHIHGSSHRTGMFGRRKQIPLEEPDDEFGNVEPRIEGHYDEEKPLILPDFEMRKNPQPMFQVDTSSSEYDNFCKEKHAPQEKTRELSREDSYDGNMIATNNPQRAVSVIRWDSQLTSNRNNSQSILSAGSSEYSQPVERQTDSRAILEGIIRETFENEEQTSEYSNPRDAESNYTSISQKAAANSAGPEAAAMPQQEKQLRQQQRSYPMMQTLPNQGPMYRNQMGGPVPQQRPAYGYPPPQKPYGQPGNMSGRPNGYMMPPRLAQPHPMAMRNGPYGPLPQQMAVRGLQPHPMAMRNGPYGPPPQQMAMGNGPYGPPPQQMAMRNGPYGPPPQQMAMRGLQPHPMAMRNGPYGPMAQPFSQSQMPGPTSNGPPMSSGPPMNNGVSGRSNYKPAYKRRVGAQNGFPAATTFDNTYGFR